MENTFNIHADFDIEGFVTACRLAGVKLDKLTEEEERDGYFVLNPGQLLVGLYVEDQTKMDIVTAKVAEFNE
jgi:hypothetical protein